MNLLSLLVMIVYRALSGLENGMIYKGNRTGSVLSGIGMFAMVIVMGLVMMNMEWIWGSEWGVIVSIVVWIGMGVGILSTIGIYNSWERGLGWMVRDIHFWESIQNGWIGIVGILSGVDLVYLWVSVVVGQVFHKGFVNWGCGLGFIEGREVTDDLSGRTYGIPYLDIVVRRMSNGWLRLGLAIGGLIWVIVNEIFFGIRLGIWDIILR